MNASERIREALLRSEAARKSGHSEATATTTEGPVTSGPLTPVDEPATHAPEEVESTLPLLGASDEEKVKRGPTATGSSPVKADRKAKIVYVCAGLVLAGAGLAAYLLRDHWSGQPNATPRRVQVEATAQPAPVASTPAPAAADATPAAPPADHSQDGPAAPSPQPRVESTPPVKVIETPPAAKAEVRSFTPPPVQPQKTVSGEEIVLDPSPTAIPGTSSVQTTAALPQMVSHAPAPPPKPAPAPLRIGGKVLPPVLVRRIPPMYPAMAKSAHVEGTVRLLASIGKDGRVRDLQFVSGPRMLVQAAKDAIKGWVYQPSRLDGEAVEVTTEIDLQFKLNQ